MAIVGLYGGSFDPVHAGHLHVAGATMASGLVSRVVFCPARATVDKPSYHVSDEHRLAMVRLAAQTLDGCEVTDVELTRPGPSYTVDTIRAFKDPETRLRLILGDDCLQGLPFWKDVNEVLQTAPPIFVPRLHSSEVVADKFRAMFPDYKFDVLSDAVMCPVSSTDIRTGAGNILHAVPDFVLQYIADHDLY